MQQYGAYETLPGLHLNGQLTLGENIADTAGLTIAYDAYRRTLSDAPAPVIDGFTGDQRFFLGFAQVWRTVAREFCAAPGTGSRPTLARPHPDAHSAELRSLVRRIRRQTRRDLVPYP